MDHDSLIGTSVFVDDGARTYLHAFHVADILPKVVIVLLAAASIARRVLSMEFVQFRETLYLGSVRLNRDGPRKGEAVLKRCWFLGTLEGQILAPRGTRQLSCCRSNATPTEV